MKKPEEFVSRYENLHLMRKARMQLEDLKWSLQLSKSEIVRSLIDEAHKRVFAEKLR